MWGRQYFCLALILALAWGPAAAIAGDPDYALERKKFRQAEQALVQGQRTRFHALLAELKHYPLYPYLRYRELRRYLSRATAQEIAAFLDEYGDTPMAPRLRRAWLQRLAKRKRWREYLIFYTPQSRAALQCNYHRALLETGQTREALEGIEALWLVGKSQHAACDPVFRAWRKAGGLSRKLVWQRIGLAMAKRNRSLARYLSRYLPKQDLRFVRPWIEVDRNPALVTRHPRLREDSPQARDILVHGIRRLMRTSLDRAARAWDTLKVRYAFSTEQRATVEGQLALRYALQGRPQALERLAALDLSRNEDESLREWRIRVALKLKDWEAVLTWVEHLPEAEREEPRWRYWRARALEALGNNEAREEFEALADTRHYYGFLAADHLGLPYAFHYQPLDFSEESLKNVESTPGIQRAKELYRLGRMSQARLEWYYATHNMPEQQRARAALIAQRWGWHDRAIFTVARTAYVDDLELRFPTPYVSDVTALADKYNIDPAWAFAVIRQESAFMADARSPAGALGLMQLMPQTAKTVARRLKARYRGSRQLLDAGTNLRFGISYLRTEWEHFNRHSVLATAAYNAGRYRVRRWLPEHESRAADLWVETVPFKETREYLQNVFAYTVVYDYRLGREPQSLRVRMPPVQGRDATLSRRQASTGKTPG